MEFKKFKKAIQENFKEISKDVNHLFEVGLDKDQLWNTYLNSFPAGTNPIFRERTEFDCTCCKQFIRNIGNVVVLKNNKITTIWDVQAGSATFQTVTDELSKYIKSKVIENVYVTKLSKIGTDRNFEKPENGEIIEWTHFYLELPDKFVDKSGRSEGDIKGTFKSTRDVFKSSLNQITEDSILTVLELISSNSLHRGTEWKAPLTEFLKHKKAYNKLQTEEEKENYSWEQSVKVGEVVGRMKNHSMGTLLVNISEGMDLETAVGKFEFIVGDGYKRSKPLYTEKMLKDAKKTFIGLGYDEETLCRRYSNLNDVTINNILFSNKDSAKRISNVDVFGQMLGEATVNPKKFAKVEEISISDFISNVLPNAQEIEAYLENKHANNMVSLIAPKNKDSKVMLKWNNNFSWAYAGNITDSSMKQNVKSAGGDVDGVLRFSIEWNNDKYDPNDLDAHCIEPKGNEISFRHKVNSDTSGKLDVDIISPTKGKPAVENITWTNRNKMQEGDYDLFVNGYSNRGGRGGFKAEVEFDGQLYSFEYNKEVRQSEDVKVATVTFNRSTGFTIKEKLPSSVSSKDIWNLKTNNFIPVSVAMYSPNYWDEQNGIGHRHYFFMLKDCINPEMPNGFYNEFLKEDLMKHKNVFEALGSKMRVEDIDDQLSGLGFSSTKRNELLVKVKGQTERVLKIKF
jgi:hypothetical protein